MKKLSRNKGFTLIEILVVIGIIAILATIVIIAINPSRQFKQARDTQRTSNVNAILNAIGQYVADNKGDLPSVPSGEVNQALCDDLVPMYLPSLPTDPNSDSKGSSITCSGISTNDVGYDTSVSGGRVTVSAPDAELSTISVTR
ncbi:MAG: type II secretion system protein [Candidatus Pacebacteria bacterium]|nr:type II secretion system protein [Candidatus Paceibacterota bacterium]